MADFKFVTCGDELRTVPETGCRLYGGTIYDGGNQECQPSHDIVHYSVLLHIFLCKKLFGGKNTKNIAVCDPHVDVISWQGLFFHFFSDFMEGIDSLDCLDFLEFLDFLEALDSLDFLDFLDSLDDLEKADGF